MNTKKITRIYHLIRCVPKTLFFNFYYFSFKDAKTAKIKLGFGRVQVADNKYSRFIWNVEKDATVTFGHNVRIGTGSRLDVSGKLSFGDGCNFSGESSIVCQKAISFGQSCLVSWQTLFMDSDLHKITDNSGIQTNPNKAILIGDNVWVGAKASILKGTHIEGYSVVANNAVVVKSFEKNSVIGGNPAIKIGDFKDKYFHH